MKNDFFFLRYEAIAPKQEPQLKKSKEENKENVSQKTSNNDQINETFSSGQSRYINCTEVYNIMRNQCDDLLLLDCRRREHFEESSIVFKHIINIPSENINGFVFPFAISAKYHSKTIH